MQSVALNSRSTSGLCERLRWVESARRLLHAGHMQPLRFVHLNPDWNAEPNAPGERVLISGEQVILSFDLNPWAFKAREGERAELVFGDCARWRLGATNDEGWYRGQCRYSGAAPRWGEYYEITGDDPVRDLPEDWVEVSPLTSAHRHFLFYLRDQTFECMAADWRLDRRSLYGREGS